MAAGSVTFDAGCTTATSIISSGGADGAATVNYVLSNLDSCVGAADGFIVTLPFDLDGAVASVVTMSLVTESGDVPVDNVSLVPLSLTRSASAFTAEIDTTGYTAVVADVGAGLGPYRDYVNGTPETIGDVEIAVDTNVVVDLNGAGAVTFASAADVAGATVTVTGDMSAYSGAGGVDLAGVAEATIAGSVATRVLSAPQLAAVISASAGGTLNASDEVVELRSNGTSQIQASTYSATVAVDLVATLTDESVTASLLPVTRNGTSVTLPWTASNTQAAGTGSSNFVRVSNPTAAAYGPIFATVLSGTVSGLVGTTATISPSLAAGAEVLFTAAQLETALGNFGRADIQITVEGQGAIVKRLIQRPDGTYEINNVTP